MHRQIQRPNASLHGGFERRRSNHPTYPRKHPPHEGFRHCRSNCPPSTPSVPRAPARGQNITEWQETSIMYACAAEGPLSGKISLKCTLGQPILARMAYFALFKMGKRCRGVHLANISPERSGFLARAYIMLVSCRAFRLFARCLGRFSSMISRRSQRPHPHASPTSAQRPSPEKQRMH